MGHAHGSSSQGPYGGRLWTLLLGSALGIPVTLLLGSLLGVPVYPPVTLLLGSLLGVPMDSPPGTLAWDAHVPSCWGPHGGRPWTFLPGSLWGMSVDPPPRSLLETTVDHPVDICLYVKDVETGFCLLVCLIIFH